MFACSLSSTSEEMALPAFKEPTLHHHTGHNCQVVTTPGTSRRPATRHLWNSITQITGSRVSLKSNSGPPSLTREPAVSHTQPKTPESNLLLGVLGVLAVRSPESEQARIPAFPWPWRFPASFRPGVLFRPETGLGPNRSTSTGGSPQPPESRVSAGARGFESNTQFGRRPTANPICAGPRP